jgi:hypothetical protein
MHLLALADSVLTAERKLATVTAGDEVLVFSQGQMIVTDDDYWFAEIESRREKLAEAVPYALELRAEGVVGGE